MNLITEWQLQIKTVSEANCSQHWRLKQKRHKAQQKMITIKFLQERPKFTFPIHIKLTRISRLSLDAHDNLPCSMKYIVDAIAAHLTQDFRSGQADSDKRITWEYAQEKGAPQAIKIGFYHGN